ncbi:MAG: hypothetical protein PHO10_04290 [Gemmiger sp.]|nr:hypothetical protein [Gemmiger sp.]
MKNGNKLAALAQKAVNHMVNAELYDWPPYCPLLSYQPHRPEQRPQTAPQHESADTNPAQ